MCRAILPVAARADESSVAGASVWMSGEQGAARVAESSAAGILPSRSQGKVWLRIGHLAGCGRWLHWLYWQTESLDIESD